MDNGEEVYRVHTNRFNSQIKNDLEAVLNGSYNLLDEPIQELTQVSDYFDSVRQIQNTKQLIEEQENTLKYVKRNIDESDILRLSATNKSTKNYFDGVKQKYLYLKKNIKIAKELLEEINQRYHPCTLDNIQHVFSTSNERLNNFHQVRRDGNYKPNKHRWILLEKDWFQKRLNEIQENRYVSFVHDIGWYPEYRHIATDHYNLIRRIEEAIRNLNFDFMSIRIY